MQPSGPAVLRSSRSCQLASGECGQRERPRVAAGRDRAAGGTRPVSRSYIHAAAGQLGITAQNLRADRLHSEAQAAGGDPLQLTHLFGISDPAAIRYCAELDKITASPGGSVTPP